jgi:hypothetical protein
MSNQPGAAGSMLREQKHGGSRDKGRVSSRQTDSLFSRNLAIVVRCAR